EDARALRAALAPAAAEDLPQLDRLADGVRVAEQVRRGRRAEHGDLRRQGDVGLREELPGLQVPVANLRVFLRDRGDLRVPVLAGRRDLPAAGALLRLDGLDRRAELVLQ